MTVELKVSSSATATEGSLQELAEVRFGKISFLAWVILVSQIVNRNFVESSTTADYYCQRAYHQILASAKS
jgi:hypothetical protein